MGKKTFELIEQIDGEKRQKLNAYSDIVANILYSRGITTNELAKDFIDVKYELHDPFLLKDMDMAVERILKAMSDDQKICIFSDYDADGVPGAVVLHDLFKKVGYENFFVYIPHRNIEGFGLNDGAVRELKEKEVDLVITIDCGIADIDQVKLINELGMEVIITDHHEVVHGLPEAFAVIDPKREDCEYPFPELCGSGVIFKVVQGLILKGQFDINEGWEKWLLDMVGLATISDMVPLVGENRVFAKYGLIVLQKNRRMGVSEVLDAARVNPKYITEEDIGFVISPRINAASRMGHPETAFKMLSSTDRGEAKKLVQELQKLNDERKGVVAGMVKDIKKYVKENLVVDGKLTVPVIVRGNPKWSPSLMGLAANTIVEEYGVPVFLWGRGEGSELKGSARSDGSVSLIEIMTNMPEGILETYGGHVMAGGFVLSIDGIDTMEPEMIKVVDELKNEGGDLKVPVHGKLDISDVNWKLFDEIKKLAPFGMGNERPVFLFENVRVNEVQKFGKADAHIKLKFDGIEAIQFFGGGNPMFNLKEGDTLTFSAYIEKSVFGGNLELRLRLVDLF